MYVFAKMRISVKRSAYADLYYFKYIIKIYVCIYLSIVKRRYTYGVLGVINISKSIEKNEVKKCIILYQN